MATVVSVMDREGWLARTDNIVAVDPAAKRALWVPRDLWCAAVGDRINTAFASGGHDALRAALAEHGIAVQHSLCLARSAVERALADLTLTVPVERPLEFYYPLHPHARVQDGYKIVSFNPPEERLEGERVHHWLGARKAVGGGGGDLARIARQQVFVRRLLETRFPFARVLADPDLVRASGPEALAEAASVRADWRFETLDGVAATWVGGKQVLQRGRRTALIRRLAASAVMQRVAATAPGRVAARLHRLVNADRWRAAGRLVLSMFSVPSGGLRAPTRRVRLLAMLAVRNGMAYLPGYLANLDEHVDGIVAIDDGSTDGSVDLLAASPKVLEVISVPPERPTWNEAENYRRLHAAALRHDAEWLLSLDVDERVEIGFRARAERVIRRGGRLGVQAFAVRLRELWGSRETYRCDGVWGRKRVARLFRALPDHHFDLRPLHAVKAPLQARLFGGFVAADLDVYHLRMVRREDREARRDRYKALDPTARWQRERGYDYLTDERGLRLRRVERRRRFVEEANAVP